MNVDLKMNKLIVVGAFVIVVLALFALSEWLY